MRMDGSRTLRAILLGAGTLGLLPLFAAGQKSPANAKPEDKFADEPYVIEELTTVARFEADGKGQREAKVRVRIQSESAVREFGLLVYPFMASFENLDVVYVRVRKPDGAVVDTPAEDIQELDSAVSREAPMYTDQREKHIAVKSLAAGDVLEADLRWTIHDPIAPGHFWYDDSFFTAGICLDESLEVNVPANVPITAEGTKPEIKEEAGRKRFLFHSSHLDKAKANSAPSKDEIPAWEKNFHGVAPASVRFSSFSSWAEVGAWYNDVQKSRIEVTPRIRSTEEEITKGKQTPDEKLRAIYEYVSSRIRYIGIDLGAGRYQPHTAEDVLTNRYGDCKDKHTLFAALLRAAGIPAFPVLIGSSYKQDGALPSPSLFDHVITAIPSGSTFSFLDTTPEVAPYGLLIASLRDRKALVIPPDSPAQLVSTPADPPGANVEVFRMDGSLDLKGTFSGKARLEDTGDGEIVLRSAYRNTAQNRWTELTQNLIARLGFGGTVSNVTAGQPEQLSEPFWIAYDYQRPTYGDWEHHRITLPFPPLFVQDLNEAQKKSKDPLPLGSPQTISQIASVKLPEDISPTIPEHVHKETDFGEYEAMYRFENGVLHGKRKLTFKLREVPGNERAAYVDFVQAIKDDLDQWIFLTMDFATFSPAKKAEGLIREGKVQEAVEYLEKSAGESPGDKAIAFALGHAYLRLPDVEKANAQFTKVLALDSSPAFLNDVAWEYAEAGLGLEKSVEYAKRAVKATSEETTKVELSDISLRDFSKMGLLAAEWDTLGWAEFRSGHYATAEKYLAAAWALQQKAAGGEHLAEAYEKLGRRREADHVCRLALSALGMTGPSETKSKLLALQKRLGITKPEARQRPLTAAL